MKTVRFALQGVLMGLGAGVLLTGCAGPDGQSSGMYGLSSGRVRSQLTTTPVTTPAELVRWTQFQPNMKSFPLLRAVDVYGFSAPSMADERADLETFLATAPPGTTFTEAAGGAADGSKAYILHTPGQR